MDPPTETAIGFWRLAIGSLAPAAPAMRDWRELEEIREQAEWSGLECWPSAVVFPSLGTARAESSRPTGNEE